jgi:hypothetical protein
MANFVGCVAMSHGPQLMLDPDHWHLLATRASEQLPDKPELERETHEVQWAKWNGCREAITKLREKINALSPDVLIVVGDDQHENLIDDNMPPFTIYMGEEAEASVSLRYLKQPRSENRTKYHVDAKMAKALVNGLMDAGFDPSYSKQTRYDGGLGHAFARVLKFLIPEPNCRVIRDGQYLLSARAFSEALSTVRPSAGVNHPAVLQPRPCRSRRIGRTQPYEN